VILRRVDRLTTGTLVKIGERGAHLWRVGEIRKELQIFIVELYAGEQGEVWKVRQERMCPDDLVEVIQ
jgi:hypothetical protein